MDQTPVTDRSTETLRLDKARLENALTQIDMADRRTPEEVKRERVLTAEWKAVVGELRRRGES